MKYIVSWTNTDQDARQTVTVHSSRAVEEIRATLARRPWKHTDIVVRAVQPTRFRDIIITYES